MENINPTTGNGRIGSMCIDDELVFLIDSTDIIFCKHDTQLLEQLARKVMLHIAKMDGSYLFLKEWQKFASLLSLMKKTRNWELLEVSVKALGVVAKTPKELKKCKIFPGLNYRDLIKLRNV